MLKDKLQTGQLPVFIIHRGEAMLRNTCANGIKARNALTFHSVENLHKNTDSQLK